MLACAWVIGFEIYCGHDGVTYDSFAWVILDPFGHGA